MRGTTTSLVGVATTLLSITPTAFAKNSKIIPCVIGNGNSELCDSCDESKAIEVTSWDNATWVKDFTMGDAPSDTGLGYKVYWKIEQPADNCRILLFDGFNSDKGSIEPRLSGRIKLSVNKGGCYVSTIRSSGVGVGACCGTDCTNIGAFPGAPTMKRDKLPQPPSRVMRSVVTSNTRPLSIGDSDEYRALQGRSNVEEAQTRPLSIGDSDEHRALQARKIAEETQNTRPLSIGDHPLDERKLAQRATGGQHPNPWGGQPAPPAPKWNCKAEKNGDTYFKSGKQVVDGNSFPCGSDIGCDMSVDFQASVASSISSEKTTTYTNSEGTTHEATVGWMYAGPTATYTFSYNKEFSEAVASSTGTSNTETKSRGVAFRWQVTAGFEYNGWWAPTLTCQMWTLSCDQGQGPFEKCDPFLDINKNPVGAQGIMTTGQAS